MSRALQCAVSNLPRTAPTQGPFADKPRLVTACRRRFSSKETVFRLKKGKNSRRPKVGRADIAYLQCTRTIDGVFVGGRIDIAVPDVSLRGTDDLTTQSEGQRHGKSAICLDAVLRPERELG